MCDASGEASRHVTPRRLETLARAGEGRVASAATLWTRSRNATRRQAAQTGCPVGRGVSQVLAGIARSPGRIFRKGEPAIGEKENEVKGKSDMCPACIANITVMTVGATSGGGVAAFVFQQVLQEQQTNKDRGQSK